VRILAESKVDLIFLVGGDGTAKDILDAMKNNGVDCQFWAFPPQA